jgi:hypothetical protein
VDQCEFLAFGYLCLHILCSKDIGTSLCLSLAISASRASLLGILKGEGKGQEQEQEQERANRPCLFAEKGNGFSG